MDPCVRPLLVSVLSALALTGLGRQAAAKEMRYTFQYTGFDYVSRSDWGTGSAGSAPDQTFSGRFAGEDRNGNGILERVELSQFKLNDQDYLSCPSGPWGYLACQLNTFSFSPDGSLQFSGQYRQSDGEAIDWTTTVESGVHITFNRWVLGRVDETRYQWTPETALLVRAIAAPVPEPSHALMLAGGLCVLLAMARRRRTAHC